MNILDTHIHYLRFRINCLATKKCIDKWKKIKQNCENGNNVHIIEQIKNCCMSELNKKIKKLDIVEGGFNVSDNINDCEIHKQIRFRYYVNNNTNNLTDNLIDIDNDIVLDVHNTDTEKWTYNELDDIIYAFIKICVDCMHTNCVDGCIEMVNNNVINDDYFG